MIEEASLWAITPLDGRYHQLTKDLSTYVSEGALINYRLKVEIHWLRHLLGLTTSGQNITGIEIGDIEKSQLLTLAEALNKETASAVKEIEKTTNHDVKACEYFLRNKLSSLGFSKSVLALIHFGCTSEDINNLAYALMMKDLLNKIIFPQMNKLISELARMSKDFAYSSMLSRTHGQSASPTTMGKEFSVFASRLHRIKLSLTKVPILAKLNGAVGNYNAHAISYSEYDFRTISRNFIEQELKLTFNPYTTQIENHDGIAEFCQTLMRYNTVSIDLCRDIWAYISFGYFRLKSVKTEVGSSTMPHKVNPIDFENAEGNFGVANAIGEHFAQKLPISRLQRDLSDSTVLRSLGSFLGYHFIAQSALLKGLGKLEQDVTTMEADLSEHWEVLTEAVQSVMRRYGIDDAYEQLKALSRGQKLTKRDLHDFIDRSVLPKQAKQKLLSLTPMNYVGYAPELAIEFYNEVATISERN